MKDLKPIRGRRYILELISAGEHETQDFKYAINDARKIARSISAFANHRGGHLLVGVKDNGMIAGVRNEEDIYVIEQAGNSYCYPPVDIDFTAFSTGETGIVIRAKVEPAESKPVRVRESDGKLKAYFRVADENITAHPLMVRAWQQQASPLAQSLDLECQAAKSILGKLSNGARLPIEEALRSCAASRRTMQDVIVSLAAMRVVDFYYDSAQGFCLMPGSDLADD